MLLTASSFYTKRNVDVKSQPDFYLAANLDIFSINLIKYYMI